MAPPLNSESSSWFEILSKWLHLNSARTQIWHTPWLDIHSRWFGCSSDSLGGPIEDSKTIFYFHKSLNIGGILKSLDEISQVVSLGLPLLLKSWRRRCMNPRSCRWRWLALLDRCRFDGPTLLASRLRGTARWRWCGYSTSSVAGLSNVLACLTIVIVYTLHVITKIPAAWKAISRKRTLTTIIGTSERLSTMAMHTVSFALMTEQTGSGRETGIFTSSYLATVWLQMRINKFAISQG